MVTDKLKLLARIKAQAAKLEASLVTQRPAALAALPADFGFPDLKSFIKALKAAAHAKPKATRAPKATTAKPRKRKRARVTEEIKAAVKAAFEAGQRTGAIAKEVGISPASVMALKKSFGFTKPRAAAPAAPAAAAPAAPDPVALG
jgi:transposase-like protein